MSKRKFVPPARVLVADPPWKFSDGLPGPKRGARKHYKTMSVADIRHFPLPPVTDDALLFLWRVASMQEEALSVVRAWGFVPKSEIVWLKTGQEDRDLVVRIGKLSKHRATDEELIEIAIAEARRTSFGMGRYTRQAHEVCLIAKRGMASVKSRSQRSVFYAPRGAHSEKPDEFFRIVESLADGPYVELFARKQREGWSCFGDELPGRLPEHRL